MKTTGGTMPKTITVRRNQLDQFATRPAQPEQLDQATKDAMFRRAAEALPVIRCICCGARWHEVQHD